jgi:peptide/nickel transport system permease protein
MYSVERRGLQMKVIRSLLLIFTGFIFISALPKLFFAADFQYVQLTGESNSFGFYPVKYAAAIFDVVKKMFQPEHWSLMRMGKEYALADIIGERAWYSMKVFLFSLALALIIAFIISIAITLARGMIQQLLISLVNVMESLPDIFIIIGVQLLVVTYFRQTGVLIGDIAMLNEEIYLLPVTCLTVIPAVFLTKTLVLLLREEDQKPYIELARGKGLSSLRVLVLHSFRNVIYSLFYRSKLIFSFMLSNLFILERLFNMRGVMDLLMWSSGHSFVLISTIIFMPFFLLFTFVELRMKKSIGMKEDGTYA